MKTEWFVANVTALESPETVEYAILGVIFPDTAERAILMVILASFFWPSPAVFAIGEPLSEAGTPS